MDLGWWGEVDVPAAVTFLAAREEIDDARIGVVGLSMGGEQAIGALAVDPRIRVVVAEGNYLLVDREPWGRIRDRLEALALYQHHERVNARHYVDGGYPDRPFKVG